MLFTLHVSLINVKNLYASSFSVMIINKKWTFNAGYKFLSWACKWLVLGSPGISRARLAQDYEYCREPHLSRVHWAMSIAGSPWLVQGSLGYEYCRVSPTCPGFTGLWVIYGLPDFSRVHWAISIVGPNRNTSWLFVSLITRKCPCFSRSSPGPPPRAFLINIYTIAKIADAYVSFKNNNNKRL